MDSRRRAPLFAGETGSRSKAKWMLMGVGAFVFIFVVFSFWPSSSPSATSGRKEASEQQQINLAQQKELETQIDILEREIEKKQLETITRDETSKHNSETVNSGSSSTKPAGFYRGCKPTRFGGSHGWSLCVNGFGPETIIYAVGVGEDMSFDIDIVDKLNVTVYSFDPTPKSIAYVNKYIDTDDKVRSFFDKGRMNFFPFGLYSKDTFLPFHLPKVSSHVSGSLVNAGHLNREDTVWVPVFKLKTIMEGLKHSHIDVLKIDIEGSEFEVVDELVKMDDIPVDQLLIELHGRFWSTKAQGEALVQRLKDSLEAKGYSFVQQSNEDLGVIKTELYK